MKKTLGLVTTLVFAFALSTQLLMARVDDQTFTGNLIDTACATKTAGHMDKVKGHPRSCSLMEGCTKSGFGIVTSDGKFHKFDEAGNKLALTLLQNSKTEKDVVVTVTGSEDAGTIKVTKIEEAAATAAK